MGDVPVHPDTLVKDLESSMGITVRRPSRDMSDLKVEIPSSTPKASTDAAIRVYRERHIGDSGITVENATASDLQALAQKIDLTSEKLAKPRSAQILSIALKMPVEEIEDKIQHLIDLRAAIAANLDEATGSESSHASIDDHDDHMVTPVHSRHGTYRRIRFLPPPRKEDDPGTRTTPSSRTEAEGMHYCRNETHHAETPPYRIFTSAGAKTAHLSRAHFCPYKKNYPPCPFFYEMEVELGDHLLKSHPTPKHTDQCPVCDTMVDKEHLELHKQSVHSECGNCKSWFRDLEALKLHWDDNGGACQVATVDEVPASRPTPPGPLPRSLTLATLPDLKSGHEGLLTEALSIILDTAIPDENEAAKERAKELITSYTFHQNHQRNISRNPYKALSECKPFLEIPCFKHPPGSKEKSFDKALDSAQIVELSPYTSERFSNYLKMEGLHSKMLNYIKQYNLTEPSATYLLLNHLSPDNVDVLRASYRRHPYELSYLEVTKTLQMRFYNLDLQSLRDSVGNLRRGPNEHHVSFHTRCFKLCSLAAINFTESQKAAWVESKCREIFYRSLDSNLRMEVDELESRHAITMSSTELLETYVCRANLKSTIDVGEDTLMSVARVKENKQPRRPKRVGMILSSSSKPAQAGGPPKNAGATTTKSTPPQPQNPSPAARHNANPASAPPRYPPGNGARPKAQGQGRHSSINGPRDRLRAQGPTNGRPGGAQREQPSQQRNPNRDPSQPQSTSNPFRPGSRMSDKHESIVNTLRALGLDINTLERDGLFCWSCGAGRPSMSSRPYHPRKQCSLPLYKGTPHECAPGIKLLHEPALCPRRRQRVGVVRLED